MKKMLHLGFYVCLFTSTPLSTTAAPPIFTDNGQPFFIFGWYTSYGSSSVADSEQYLSKMRHEGMNTALICYGVWLNNSSMTNQLEGAISSDMKIMVEVHRWAALEQPGYPLSLIDDQVDLCKDYSSFLNWYLMDEPELQGISTFQMKDRYNQIKTRDPDHTISVAHYAFEQFNPARPAEIYLGSEPPPYCDLLMTDTYTISEIPEFAGAMWRVAIESRDHTVLAQNHNKNAYINIVQTHGSFGLRIPTAPENRYLSYAPIVHGARGLLYWMHNAYTTDAHRSIVVPITAHEIQSLVPSIFSNSTAVIISSNRDFDGTGHGIANVTYLFGEAEGQGYLIAINNTPASTAVNFTLTGSILASMYGVQAAVIPVAFEQRDVQLLPTPNPNEWMLSDTFAPFDVNVYRLYEADASGNSSAPLAQATGPHPEHDATSIGRKFDLRWEPVPDASSYNVYFGTTDPPPLQSNQTGVSFDPGLLDHATTYYWRVDSVNETAAATTGDVWSFTTALYNPPEQVTNPIPVPGATNIDLAIGMNWKWGAGARSYKVYFGTTNPPPFHQNTNSFSIVVSNLAYCTTYYWRIDPVNDDGATTGQVWSFTTRNPSMGPAQPSNPSPLHQAVDVRVNADLIWTGANTAQYSIHFGTIDPPPFQVAQAGTIYDPGTLQPLTTYYWRIDASNQCVTVPSQVWSFTTGFLKGDLDGDDDSDQADFGLLQRCFSGQGIPHPAGCVISDLDGDGDVDQQDVSEFLPCLAGTNHLPGCI